MKHLIIFIIFGIVLIGLNLTQKEKPNTANSQSGKAAIGGTFTLTDHNGEPTTDTAFAGNYMLVFFGFTHCPEVCPTGLSLMTNVLESLGDKAKNITPVFITVDPQRDNPEVMKEYLSHFHPSFVGLTGTKEQIEAVTQTYKIYYNKAETSDPEMGYDMQHSAITYLMGKDGQFLTHFSGGTSAERMQKTIEDYLQ